MHLLVLTVILSLPPQPSQGLLVKRLSPPVLAPETTVEDGGTPAALETFASLGVTVVGLFGAAIGAIVLVPCQDCTALVVLGGGFVGAAVLPFATSAVVWAIERSARPAAQYWPILLTSFAVRASLALLGMAISLGDPKTGAPTFMSPWALGGLGAGLLAGPVGEVIAARTFAVPPAAVVGSSRVTVPLVAFAF